MKVKAVDKMSDVELKIFDGFQVLWITLSGFSNWETEGNEWVSVFIWRGCVWIAATCSCSCKQSGKPFVNLPLWKFMSIAFCLPNIHICQGLRPYITGTWTPSLLDKWGCSYLALESPGCFGGLSSAGETCADRSRAAADTDRSCCYLSETGA